MSEEATEDRADFWPHWDRDQVDLDTIITQLYNQFGASPNAPAADYMTALRAAVVAHSGLYPFTKKIMDQICTEVEAILTDVYVAKWMQAANFVGILRKYTTFAFDQ